MKNANSHILLYAKGHYLQSDDFLSDMRKLVSERSGCAVESVRIQDIILTLQSVYEESSELPSTWHKVWSLLNDLNPEAAWRFGSDKEEDFPTRYAKMLVSKMMLLQEVVNGKVMYELDEADPEVLPLNPAAQTIDKLLKKG